MQSFSASCDSSRAVDKVESVVEYEERSRLPSTSIS